MNRTTILAFASAATALASAATALADEAMGGATTDTPTGAPAGAVTGGDTTEAPKGARGGRGKAATAPVEEKKPAEVEGKTYEQLRDLISPLVQDGKGEEVKKIIAKYGSSLKDIPADKHAAFEKDIEALSL
jgi:hypothetical protein